MFITWQIVGILVAVTVVRAVWVIIYRLFFRPLAKVLGPFLGVFSFYSLWYNAHRENSVHRGRSSIKIWQFKSPHDGRYLSIDQSQAQEYASILGRGPPQRHTQETLTRSSILDLGSAKARLSMCALDLDNYKLTIPDNDVHQVRRAALNLSFRAQIVFVLEKSYKDRTEVDESGAIGVRVYGEY